MIAQLVKLLEVDECLEITNRPGEVAVRLWDTRHSVYRVHIIPMQELEQFKGNEQLLAENLIKQLRNGIKKVKKERRLP